MSKHLVKCAAFLVLQAALFLGLRGIGTRSAPPPTEPIAATHTEAFLQEQLFPYWRIAPGVLGYFADLPADDPILEAAALAFEDNADRYLAAIIDKDRLLKQTPGPRLICVGGSGLAFGWDSKLLAARYAYHPINLGLHIRLGPEFLLTHVARHVRDGDVVVISLEYDGMLAEFQTTSERREALLDIAPDLADYFEIPTGAEQTTWLARASAIQDFADNRALAEAAKQTRAVFGEAFDESFGHSGAAWEQFQIEFAEHREELLSAFGRCPLIAKQCYRRSGFNEYGDVVTHRGRPRPPHVSRSEVVPVLPAALGQEQTALLVRNLERLNRFAEECGTRGARVYFSYPPLLNTTNAEAFSRTYTDLVESHLRIPRLHGIEEMILDESLFFDSNNHLTWDGTCARMGRVIEGLDRYLPSESGLSPQEHIARRRGMAGQARRIAAARNSTVMIR